MTSPLTRLSQLGGSASRTRAISNCVRRTAHHLNRTVFSLEHWRRLMKLSRIALSLMFAAAVGLAVPQAYAGSPGKSGSHRKDGSHGHKGGKGGKSSGHRNDGAHGHKGNKGGKSGDHRKDGGHRNPKSGDHGR
jgi:hypothetical protein